MQGLRQTTGHSHKHIPAWPLYQIPATAASPLPTSTCCQVHAELHSSTRSGLSCGQTITPIGAWIGRVEGSSWLSISHLWLLAATVSCAASHTCRNGCKHMLTTNEEASGTANVTATASKQGLPACTAQTLTSVPVYSLPGHFKTVMQANCLGT